MEPTQSKNGPSYKKSVTVAKVKKLKARLGSCFLLGDYPPALDLELDGFPEESPALHRTDSVSHQIYSHPHEVNRPHSPRSLTSILDKDKCQESLASEDLLINNFLN